MLLAVWPRRGNWGTGSLFYGGCVCERERETLTWPEQSESKEQISSLWSDKSRSLLSFSGDTSIRARWCVFIIELRFKVNFTKRRKKSEVQLDGKFKAWIEEVGRSVGSENRHLRNIFKSTFSVASFHQVPLDIKILPFVGKEACGEKGKPCAPTDCILRKNELNADFTFTGGAFSFHTMNTWMNIFM